jgi:hypothetical protein
MRAAYTNPPIGANENIFEAILEGAASLATDGYVANVLLLSPANALDLALLRQPGSDDYAAGAAVLDLLNGIERRVCKSVTDPVLLDRDAAGVLFLSPVRFATFEENAGATNSTSLRLESHGAFNVERPDAIRTLATGS